jgi:uncharacterized protein (TIGR00369 family)
MDDADQRRSREVRWQDPAAVAAAMQRLDGRAWLEAVADGREPAPPMADLLGLRVVRAGDGEAVFACAPDESVYNAADMVHGGWLCAVLDTAAGCAIQSRLPAGATFATLEIKVSFLEALRGDSGTVEARGRVTRMGGRVAFAEAHARTAGGLLVGHATTTAAVVRLDR